MKYKRRSKAPAFQAAMPAKLLALLLLVFALFMVFAWGKARSQCLGKQVKRLEAELEKVSKVHSSELLKWQNMKTPANVESMLARHQIKMVWPAESDIVRIRPSTAPDAPSTMFEGRLASGVRATKPKGGKP